jgi:hypothetical protein
MFSCVIADVQDETRHDSRTLIATVSAQHCLCTVSHQDHFAKNRKDTMTEVRWTGAGSAMLSGEYRVFLDGDRQQDVVSPVIRRSPDKLG